MEAATEQIVRLSRHQPQHPHGATGKWRPHEQNHEPNQCHAQLPNGCEARERDEPQIPAPNSTDYKQHLPCRFAVTYEVA